MVHLFMSPISKIQMVSFTKWSKSISLHKELIWKDNLEFSNVEKMYGFIFILFENVGNEDWFNPHLVEIQLS
jgi:hypothetical protein